MGLFYFGDGMKEIPLTCGMVAIVDDEDFERLSQFKWHWNASYARRTIVESRKGNKKRMCRAVLMHRFILDIPLDKKGDHVNGNTLDNRKENLRICNSLGNAQNSKKRKDNTTGFKGVSLISRISKGKRVYPGTYRVIINSGNKSIHIGVFPTIIEAARAYDRAAKKHHGEFARLNFPVESK